MKWVGLAACVLFGSVLGGGATAYYLGHADGGADRGLADGLDGSPAMTEIRNRLHDLDESLESLKNRSVTKDEYQRLVAALPTGTAKADELAALRDKLSALESAVAAGGGGLKLRLKDGDKEKVVGLEDYIEAKVTTAKEEAKREAGSMKNRIKEAKPFIKMGMTQQVNRMKTKLNLSEEQTKRMTESFDKSFEKNFPLIQSIMDPEKSKEDKQLAAKEVEANIAEVNSDAQGYLDTTQYQQFTEEQQRNMQGLQAMINMGMGQGGGPGAGFPFPFPGGGNQGGAQGGASGTSGGNNNQ